jgi:hypothetical protein
MSVAHLNSGSKSDVAGTQLVLSNFDVGSAANRVAVFAFCISSTSIAPSSLTIGSDSGTAIAGTDANPNANRSVALWLVKLTVTGLQTVTANIASSGNWSFGLSVFSGVDQTTSTSSPQVTWGTTTSGNVVVSNSNGDMTFSACHNDTSNPSPSQTGRFSELNGNIPAYAEGDTAAGTGSNNTHTWSNLSTGIVWAIAGVNLKAASEESTLMGAACL